MEQRWEETRDVCAQLATIFQSEDAELVAALAQRAAELQDAISRTSSDVRATIKGVCAAGSARCGEA